MNQEDMTKSYDAAKFKKSDTSKRCNNNQRFDDI